MMVVAADDDGIVDGDDEDDTDREGDGDGDGDLNESDDGGVCV
jgi:hypothetical protein